MTAERAGATASTGSPVSEETGPPPTAVAVEFCGEWFPILEGGSLTIGRDADLVVDENPFLHRRLLEIRAFDGLWMLSNVGTRLSVTVSDAAGRLQSWLAPGAKLPLVFGRMSVVFTAGPTTYELTLHTASPPFSETSATSLDGVTTVGQLTLTPSQKLLILSLAEPMLAREGTGMGEIPTNAAAAARLGWAATRFSRKLDNVCEKLERIGVQGLRGDSRTYATNRRVRLVEYAISARLVTRVDLPLLDAPQPSEVDR
ncbi:hypothetical protein ACGGZK_05400 [Agromyces sp. MMS24-K17]|uniref:hypothetical protein n=1 Tax=Agromyces sp. MMS24-K17 TaxID=3372850 RepID=UPI0037543AB4